MKWDATEPNRGQFSFGGADQVVNFATQNSKQVRCHTLVWYSQLPSWVSNGGFNNQTLISVMTNHINTVMGRYKGKCTHWDVVNEGKSALDPYFVTCWPLACLASAFPRLTLLLSALNEDGTYRDNVFLRVIGEAYIPMAFRLAAAADPNAKLYYNDYNLEYAEAKAEGAARIVKLVQSYGVKIDGVGLQGHLVTENTPTQSIPTPPIETLVKALRLYTDLGVDVAYTELDIRMLTPSTAAKLQTQADAYARVATSCMMVKRCVGITLWVSYPIIPSTSWFTCLFEGQCADNLGKQGVSDKYSWVPQTFSGEGAALLWSDSYQKKPAYDAFLKAISSANSTSA